MDRLAKFQLIGPLVVALAIAAEEAAAYALLLKPSSIVAWYLNLEVFGIFQRSHYVLSDKLSIPYFQLLFIAIPILALAGAGYALRRPLLSATASNLSFVYVVFLAHAWQIVKTPSLVAASLAGEPLHPVFAGSMISLPSGPPGFVLVAIGIPALLSFAASHLFYVRAVRHT